MRCDAMPTARAVRLSINIDKSDGRTRRAMGRTARNQLMWIVGLNIEADTDQVFHAQWGIPDGLFKGGRFMCLHFCISCIFTTEFDSD